MAILTPDDFPEIRAVIDADLAESDLPDSTINMDIYRGRADSRVIALVPTAESMTGTNATHVRRAAIFFCASYLVPAVVRLTSVSTQTRDLSYQRNLYDPDKLKAGLEAAAAAEIAEVNEPSEEAPNRPTMFARAPGTRGR